MKKHETTFTSEQPDRGKSQVKSGSGIVVGGNYLERHVGGQTYRIQVTEVGLEDEEGVYFRAEKSFGGNWSDVDVHLKHIGLEKYPDHNLWDNSAWIEDPTKAGFWRRVAIRLAIAAGKIS